MFFFSIRCRRATRQRWLSCPAAKTLLREIEFAICFAPKNSTYQKRFVVLFAAIRIHIGVIVVHRNVIAFDQCRLCMPERRTCFVNREMEFASFSSHHERCALGARRTGSPGLPCVNPAFLPSFTASVGGPRRDLSFGPLIFPTGSFTSSRDWGSFCVPFPVFAVEHDGRAAQRQIKRRINFGNFVVVLVRPRSAYRTGSCRIVIT